MELTKRQIKIVRDEFKAKLAFEPNFRKFSRRLFVKDKLEVWVTFKDGKFSEADEKDLNSHRHLYSS